MVSKVLVTPFGFDMVGGAAQWVPALPGESFDDVVNRLYNDVVDKGRPEQFAYLVTAEDASETFLIVTNEQLTTESLVRMNNEDDVDEGDEDDEGDDDEDYEGEEDEEAEDEDPSQPPG